MRIVANGNVGIGTSSPTRNLVVNNSNGNAFISARSQDTGFAGLLLGDQTSDATGQISYSNNVDSMQFLTAGSEKMRITSGGNVGIGTSSPTSKLTVQSDSIANNTSQDIVHLGDGGIGGAGISLNRYTNAQNYGLSFFTTSGTASEKLRITNSGRVGIGATSPGSRLQIGDGTADSSNFITFGKRVTSSQTSLPVIGHTSDGTASDLGICVTSSAGSIRFYTGNGASGFGAGSNAERMRLLSDGSMMFGQTSTVSPGNGNTTIGIGFAKSTSGVRLHLNMSGTTGLFVGRNNNGTCTDFRRAGVQVGRININTSSVSYSTNSDYRLKENVVVLDNAIDRVKQLLPKRFNFINDPLTLDGFLAHEAQNVVPEAVDGEQDEIEPIGTVTEWDGTVLETDVAEPDDLTWEETVTDEDGNESTETRTRTWTQTGTQPVYQSIDQAKLVPLLTAALQEAIARIEALENA